MPETKPIVGYIKIPQQQVASRSYVGHDGSEKVILLFIAHRQHEDGIVEEIKCELFRTDWRAKWLHEAMKSGQPVALEKLEYSDRGQCWNVTPAYTKPAQPQGGRSGSSYGNRQGWTGRSSGSYGKQSYAGKKHTIEEWWEITGICVQHAANIVGNLEGIDKATAATVVSNLVQSFWVAARENVIAFVGDPQPQAQASQLPATQAQPAQQVTQQAAPAPAWPTPPPPMQPTAGAAAWPTFQAPPASTTAPQSFSAPQTPQSVLGQYVMRIQGNKDGASLMAARDAIKADPSLSDVDRSSLLTMVNSALADIING